MKKLKAKQKKIFLTAVALVLAAAIGAGIWFGARGSAEPVNVYPFNYLGMTEYWGDSQESYGPVSTDKIQTVYLSDTQTVTEVLVAEGDEVKQGDVLMTFDTTLTELELERKRLEVEKQKLDLQDAENQLRKIRNMVPMDPDAMNITLPEPAEPELGEKLSGAYAISQKTEYDGSAVDKAMILWMKDGGHIDDAIFREMLLTAQTYRAENGQKPNSSASDTPDEPDLLTQDEDPPQNPTPADPAPVDPAPVDPAPADPAPADPAPVDPAPADPAPADPAPVDPLPGGNEPEPVSQRVPISFVCYEDMTQKDGNNAGGMEIEVSDSDRWFGQDIPQTISGNYELWTVKRVSDGAKLDEYYVPAYPQDNEAEQAVWRSTWGSGIEVLYRRQLRQSDMTIRCNLAEESGIALVEANKAFTLHFSVFLDSAPSGGKWTWRVSPDSGEEALSATPNGNFLILSGKAGEAGQSIQCTVTATYTAADGRSVSKSFPFAVMAQETTFGDPIDDFYMILKVTEGDMSRGNRLVWQGIHVFCYEGGKYGFTLFDASSLEDHTLEPLEEEGIELPEIDFGSGFTAAEIAKMRSEQEKTVKEQQLALNMAEAEYNIMQAEVNDGKICADFDGQVVSVLTEEEARQENRPLLKVSAGGGFYVEGNVSELEKDNLQPGQEVTINDWNTGMTYTGTVESIGEFPVSPSSWSSADNANVSYYPFTAFVDSSADLQAGNYVSVMYSTSAGGNGVYLQNAFIRTEQGRSYVFVEGENGKLEKRDITVGKSLWGSYTQVLSGLTEDDYLAFPYGKTVKEGAPAVESDDLSSLYLY